MEPRVYTEGKPPQQKHPAEVLVRRFEFSTGCEFGSPEATHDRCGSGYTLADERHYQLTGDRLILMETWTMSGKTWSGTRVFQRLK